MPGDSETRQPASLPTPWTLAFVPGVWPQIRAAIASGCSCGSERGRQQRRIECLTEFAQGISFVRKPHAVRMRRW